MTVGGGRQGGFFVGGKKGINEQPTKPPPPRALRKCRSCSGNQLGIRAGNRGNRGRRISAGDGGGRRADRGRSVPARCCRTVRRLACRGRRRRAWGRCRW